MDLFSIFKGGKYFDKHMAPKCDYCQFGRRAKDGNKVLCEKRGLVDCNYSCNKFIYSPLKRIPVKQLNFVGSLADEDIYIESAGDIAEKKELENPQKKDAPKKDDAKKVDVNKDAPKPAEAKPAEQPTPAQAAPQVNQPAEQPAPAQTAPQANQPAEQPAPAQAAPQVNQPAEQPAPAQAVPQANQPAEQPAPAQAAPSLNDLSALAEAAVKAAEASENNNVQ